MLGLNIGTFYTLLLHYNSRFNMSYIKDDIFPRRIPTLCISVKLPIFILKSFHLEKCNYIFRLSP